MTDDLTGHEFIGVAGHPDDDECTYRADGTDATYCGARKESHIPAPVSDTRREDAARAEVVHEIERHVIDPDTDDCSCGATRLGFVGFPTHAEHLVDAVLAVLPALPVVDEAEVRERIAQDIEAIPVRGFSGGARLPQTVKRDAADVARGADR